MPRKGSGKPPIPTPRVRALLEALAARPRFHIGFNRAGKLVLTDGHGLAAEVAITRPQLGAAQRHGWVVRANGSADQWILSAAGRRALEISAKASSQEGGQ